MRDSLAINPAEQAQLDAKRALRAGFSALPQPENNFELLVPEDEEEEEASGRAVAVEDAAERDARLKRMREEEERKAWARRSQVVQQGLPRPANIDTSALLERLSIDDGESAAARLIHAEMVDLMKHDSITDPLPGTKTPGSAVSSYAMPADEDIDAAKAVIHRELASMVGFPDANPSQVHEGLVAVAKNEIPAEDDSWAATKATLAFHPRLRKLVHPEELSAAERAEGYSTMLNDYRDAMTKVAAKAAKAERKLGVLLGGYQARGRALSQRLTDAHAQAQATAVEVASFSRLRANESVAGPQRVALLKEEVERLETRERGLQMRYAELDRERKEAEGRVAALEDRVMAAAEAFNEEQLDAME